MQHIIEYSCKSDAKLQQIQGDKVGYEIKPDVISLWANNYDSEDVTVIIPLDELSVPRIRIQK